MGVIQNIANLNTAYSDSIEDVLDEIEEQIQNIDVENRRIRKIKNKSGRPRAVGGILNTTKKSGKRKNRYENSNYLLTLADPDEAAELSIHDFISPTISVFSQVFLESNNFEIWHEFINCTDQDKWFQNVISQQNPSIIPDNEPSSSSRAIEGRRSDHPAFSPTECFQKIDCDLRSVLRKRHVPMGALIYLEQDLVAFFINRPQSIYHLQIPNSFQRLLLHALCQYMDLLALSYNRNGARWTRVYNKNSAFKYPVVLLSAYMEQRIQRASRRNC